MALAEASFILTISPLQTLIAIHNLLITISMDVNAQFGNYSFSLKFG